MKLQTAKSAVPSVRCTHRDSSNGQCRRLVSHAHSDLCPQHHAAQKQMEAADYSEPLFENPQDFQTAQGINNSLRSLYWLTAQNRIFTCRATVLAYIGSLILRTLPQIDADNAAGIKDPTAKPIPNPNPALNTNSIPDPIPNPNQKPS